MKFGVVAVAVGWQCFSKERTIVYICVCVYARAQERESERETIFSLFCPVLQGARHLPRDGREKKIISIRESFVLYFFFC